MDLGLEGKRVLCTGGSGGIGQGICRALAAEGALVAVHHHRNEQAAKRLAAELPGPGPGPGPSAVAVGGDLGTVEGAEAAVSAASDAFGGLDILVHCAGVWPPEPLPLWRLSPERIEATLRVDLTAAFLAAGAFLRQLETQRQEHGNLVFIGSTAGIFGEADHADYAAAKSAVIFGLVRSLKNEIVRIAPRGRVNAVCPGWVRTPMTRAALEDPTLVPRVTRTMPLRKLATVTDVATQVVLLASDTASGHVSGQIVTVAGGMEGRILHE
ncbi:MAG TPA: SDR family oxidoreductase [Actinomycetota bacterium]